MDEAISTRDVCRELGLSEPALRHVLRRAGAPRPRLHPTARLFLWTRQDLKHLAAFLGPDRDMGQRNSAREGVGLATNELRARIADSDLSEGESVERSERRP